MKRINTSPISGAQELLPEDQVVFNGLKTKIADNYRRHGYFEIETPTIERTEILLAKAGGETEKQIFKVIKTNELAGDATQALRFDHTVPLARYTIEHENDLTFPFKVSQIGLDFRGERAQKGRFREFYQCDIDVIGRNNLPVSYDADVIFTLLATLKSFRISTKILARINNRKILSGLLQFLNLEEKAKDIYSIIDHIEKVSPEKTKANFAEIGLNDDEIKKLLTFVNLNGARTFVLKNLHSLGIQNELFNEGIMELGEVMRLLEEMGADEDIIADMKIIRGLDYYTGSVFEFVLPEYLEIGSICGGGRYENLTKQFDNKAFPGVGGSIGLTRLYYVLKEKNLLFEAPNVMLDYAIIPISDAEYEYAFEVAKKMRAKGLNVTVVLTEKKLGDKMTYASKVAKNGIVIGESEVKNRKMKAKDFETGETREAQV